MGVVLAILAGLVALPFLAELIRRPVHRKRAPGEFAELLQGDTHYRWSGPEGGPVAVCIHGLSTPSYVFAATERSLNTLGYRVLTYDLYGRGFSARARGPQTASFFVRQLKALLRDQGVEGPVLLVGFSMGGSIAAVYAASEPTRVSRIILIASAGLLPPVDDLRRWFWSSRGLGDWTTRVLGGLALRRELVEHRSNGTVIPNLEDRQAVETRTRGFLPAILSSRRNVLREPREVDHRIIAEQGIPVLGIWGANDPITPLAALGRLTELNPDAHHAQIPGGGHYVLQTHPAQVADAMRRFLKSD